MELKEIVGTLERSRMRPDSTEYEILFGEIMDVTFSGDHTLLNNLMETVNVQKMNEDYLVLLIGSAQTIGVENFPAYDNYYAKVNMEGERRTGVKNILQHFGFGEI